MSTVTSRIFPDHLDELRQISPEVVLDMVPFREEDAERVRAFKGVARRIVIVSSQDVYRAFGPVMANGTRARRPNSANGRFTVARAVVDCRPRLQQDRSRASGNGR